MNVGVGRYVLGICSLAIVCGGVGLAAVALRRRWFDQETGAVRSLVECLLGIAVLIAILEALGTVGLFRLGPIDAACALVGAGGWRRLRSTTAPVRQRRAARRPSPQAIAMGGVGLLVTAVIAAEWTSPTLAAYTHGIRGVDSLWYHLPWAAGFAQTGHITPPRFTDVEVLTAFGPATAELFHGLGIVLFGRDTLSPGLNLIWLALTLLAAYCIGARRGHGPIALCGVALVMATPMIVASQPGSADDDVVGIFFMLASAALLVNGAERPSMLVLAGASAGFAASVKVTLLLPVAALTVGALVLAPREQRLAHARRWLLPEFLAGGFWYVRNLIAIGNPLPWTSLGFLPTPAPTLEAHREYAITHYLTDGRVWSQFAEPAFAAALGRWWWAIVALAILTALACLLRGATPVIRVLAVVALASLAAYLATPETAGGPAGDPIGIALNVRYAAPGLALALALLAEVPLLARGRRPLLALALPIAVLIATLIRPGLWPSQHLAGSLAAGAIVLIAGALLISRRPRISVSHLRRGSLRAAAVAGLLLAVSAAAAAGYAWQGHYLRGRYAFARGVSSFAHVWALFRSVHDARVGLVGTYGGYFSYPLDGLDDSNRVQYVAAHGPHGSFTPIRTCAAWRAAVNAGHYRYLVTTPTRHFWRPKVLYPSPERGWTISDPAAHVIYQQRARGQVIDVFRLRGPLNVSGC
jgi:hypothetical protein